MNPCGLGKVRGLRVRIEPRVHREMHLQVTFLSSENVGGHWRSECCRPPPTMWPPKSQTSGTPRDVTGCGPRGSRPLEPNVVPNFSIVWWLHPFCFLSSKFIRALEAARVTGV